MLHRTFLFINVMRNVNIEKEKTPKISRYMNAVVFINQNGFKAT